MLPGTGPKLSRRQTWHAYVQESICTVASASGINLVLKIGLAIDEITKEAFEILGANGIIQAADQHSCSECTHKYKSTPDIISDNNAPTAPLVGVDGNISVPTLVANPDGDNMNIDYAPVKLVVVDGICMGPTVSKYTSDLNNHLK